MGPLAKCAAAASSMLFVACASLAGIEAPEPADTAEGTTIGPESSDSSSGRDAGSVVRERHRDSEEEDSDAAARTVTSDPPPKPKTNGEACSSSDECASNACGQQEKCVDTCTPRNEYCGGPTNSTNCCVGMFCSNFYSCQPCYRAGEQPPKTGKDQHFNELACCSGQLNPDKPSTCL
jgi:hypothetical protein